MIREPQMLNTQIADDEEERFWKAVMLQFDFDASHEEEMVDYEWMWELIFDHDESQETISWELEDYGPRYQVNLVDHDLR